MGQYYSPVIKRENELKVFNPHDFGDGWKLCEHSWLLADGVMIAVLNELEKAPAKVYWVGDYATKEKYPKLNDFTEEEMAEVKMQTTNCLVNPHHTVLPAPACFNGKFVVNHTKKEYFIIGEHEDEEEQKYFPLSILTSAGNGAGGGDYFGKNESEVGSWFGDEIGVYYILPNNDYTLRTFTFTDD